MNDRAALGIFLQNIVIVINVYARISLVPHVPHNLRRVMSLVHFVTFSHAVDLTRHVSIHRIFRWILEQMLRTFRQLSTRLEILIR